MNAAGVAAGVVGIGDVAQSAPANEQLSVAVVGVRNQGKRLAVALAAQSDVRLVALCDVDRRVLNEAHKAVLQAGTGRQPRTECDFRRILDDPAIDAVVVATPDHWHAWMTIHALQAGKHVYVETPVAHTLEEGRAMLDAQRQHNRVVGVGLPQRSGAHFQSAVAWLREGHLGKVHLAKAWTVHERKSIGHKTDAAPPADVNYDLWLGPAPARPFNPNRFHQNWQWFWEYGSGELGHWGVQMLDVALWGLDESTPSSVWAGGGKFHFVDDQETPDTLLVGYAFPKHTIAWEHRLWTGHGQEGRSTGVSFHGERGTLIVDRGGWKVYGGKEAVAAPPSADLLVAHLRNFIDAVVRNQPLNCNLATALQATSLCHLGNLAYRAGRSLAIDAGSGAPRDRATLALLERHQPRAPWVLPRA